MRKTFKMRIPRDTTIMINGSILDVDVSHNEFLQEFVEWLDSKGWNFMGATSEVTEEEAAAYLMKFIQQEKKEED